MGEAGGSGPALPPFHGERLSVLQHTPQSAGNTPERQRKGLTSRAPARVESRDHDTSHGTTVAPGAGPFQATVRPSLQPVKDTPPPLGPKGIRTGQHRGFLPRLAHLDPASLLPGCGHHSQSAPSCPVCPAKLLDPNLSLLRGPTCHLPLPTPPTPSPSGPCF